MKLFNRAHRAGARSNVGALMEEAAARYLQSAGLVIEERNYRCRLGEIDLIARDGNTLVFVEVRYRRNRRYGTASATVDARKQRKLLATANSYLQQFKQECPCRFDVVAIEGAIEGAIAGDAQNIQWIRDAFGAD